MTKKETGTNNGYLCRIMISRTHNCSPPDLEVAFALAKILLFSFASIVVKKYGFECEISLVTFW
jgi:hypothetical protein